MSGVLAWPQWDEQPGRGKDLLSGTSQGLRMMIQKRTLGWLPKPSLYNEMAAKRAKQKANHQAFLSSTSGLTAVVSNINNEQQ